MLSDDYKSREHVKLHFKIILYVCFAIGAFLLGLNFSGFFISMRPDNSPALTKNIYSDIKKKSGESATDYSKRLNDLVHQNMLRFNVDELSLKKFNLRVPATENWLLWMIPIFKPNYKIYEFISYKKALKRGSGLCSQLAMCYVSILNQNHMNARILPLGDHVVASYSDADDPSKSFVADSDIGVFIPYQIENIKQNPRIISDFYAEKTSAEFSKSLAKSFIYTDYTALSVKDYAGWKSYYFEPLSYILKWLIPIILILPLAFLKIRPKKPIKNISV
jgi:hypothetical protein